MKIENVHFCPQLHDFSQLPNCFIPKWVQLGSLCAKNDCMRWKSFTKCEHFSFFRETIFCSKVGIKFPRLVLVALGAGGYKLQLP